MNRDIRRSDVDIILYSECEKPHLFTAYGEWCIQFGRLCSITTPITRKQFDDAYIGSDCIAIDYEYTDLNALCKLMRMQFIPYTRETDEVEALKEQLNTADKRDKSYIAYLNSELERIYSVHKEESYVLFDTFMKSYKNWRICMNTGNDVILTADRGSTFYVFSMVTS